MYSNALKELTSTQWEFFAQDVLWHIGYEIIEGPSEGSDQGKDLIVRKDKFKYLVSCKHYINSNRSIGTAIEQRIMDRIIRHDCDGFIAFYSTWASSDLKSEFSQLRENKRIPVKIVEFYQTDIFEIIPTMTGFTLQKYFKNPQNLHNHINKTSWPYLPLECNICGKDIISKENISMSRIQLVRRPDHLIDLMYGCKYCLPDFGDSFRELLNDIETLKYFDDFVEIYWWEFTQVRYIEELSDMNNLINMYLSHKEVLAVPTLYSSWAILQSRVLQIVIPPHWGKWADHKRIIKIPVRTGDIYTDAINYFNSDKSVLNELLEKSTNKKTNS